MPKATDNNDMRLVHWTLGPRPGPPRTKDTYFFRVLFIRDSADDDSTIDDLTISSITLFAASYYHSASRGCVHAYVVLKHTVRLQVK
jgi:hypothetical protein